MTNRGIMKFLLMLATVLFTTTAQAFADAEEATGECQAVNEVYDLNFNRAGSDYEFLATRTTASGKVLGYPNTDEGIEKIIAHLESEGIEDEELLSKEFWTAAGSTCARTAGNKCSRYKKCKRGYSCKQTYSGGFTFCRCRQ